MQQQLAEANKAVSDSKITLDTVTTNISRAQGSLDAAQKDLQKKSQQQKSALSALGEVCQTLNITMDKTIDEQLGNQIATITAAANDIEQRIENAIKEIRENQADKEETRKIREELKRFENDVVRGQEQGVMSDEDFAKKLRQMEERKARKAQRKAKRAEQDKEAAIKLKAIGKGVAEDNSTLLEGDSVRIKGLSTVGKIVSINGKMVTVIFGDMRTKMRMERLERVKAEEKPVADTPHASLNATNLSRSTREAIDHRKLNFKQDLDVRGMRGDEAINAVTYFIDDAILVGMPRVRILHGTGTGILRQLIRQYLATIPNVTHFRDEHVQFGGHGITVVDLE